MAVVEPPPAPATTGFRAMGSDVRVAIDAPDDIRDDDLLDRARRRIEALERVWSRFLPESEISRLNQTDGWVEVSADTLTLLDHAMTAWWLTGGAFDPTILPSLVANGYAASRSESAGRTVLPGPARHGPAPGPTGIEIDRIESRVRLPAEMAFDPGGIGKGLGADLVSQELITSGATAAMVAIGGDLRVAGRAPEEWVVAVEDPCDPELILAELRLADGAVCTSSVRAKTWVEAGTPMHHLVDPRTGEPMDTSIVSATVVAGAGWLAEALCKAALLGDPPAALVFLESANAAGLLVDVDGLVWRTPSLERFVA